MKRIFSILAVVALVVALAVPTFASADYSVSGVWLLNETVTSLHGNQDVNYTSNGESFKRMFVGSNEISYHRYPFSSSQTSYVKVYTGTWKSEEYRYIDFGTVPQTVSSSYYNWLVNNAVKQECNGTTCPATDLDHDDICDDCGMPFVYSLRDDTVYSFNGVNLPIITDELIEEYGYFVILDKGTTAYTLIASNTPIKEQAGKVIVEGSTKLAFLSANHSSTSWSQYSTQTVTGYSLGDTAQVLWTSHNVRNVDSGDQVLSGDANFMPPLWETMEQVTQGETPGMTETVVGTMTTLVLCGVGCLALLVVLKLFGKRSLIYRG